MVSFSTSLRAIVRSPDEFMTCALFYRQVENSASKHKRRDAICGGSPLFSCPIAFHNPGVFLLSLPRNWRGYSRLSNALSSHRPYGVRRQTFWQRPPFSRSLLIEIFGRVTGLSGPAMHIFSGLVQFGQMCSGGCKSAGRPTVVISPMPFIDRPNAVRTGRTPIGLESK